MHVYLPIAELSEPAWLLIALGYITGIISGLFGVGGGFILTPFLIFLGINPAVAVATSACQIVASSFSGFLHHWKHKKVDTQMGNLLVIGGAIGGILGIVIFNALKRTGQADITITIMYITLLGIISIFMLKEAIHLIRAQECDASTPYFTFVWVEKLPLQITFAKSHVTHSLLLPIAIGLIVGLLVSLMGVGGGFILIPAMAYMLRMPSSVIVGTSLYQMIFITAMVTMLHALATQTVDMVLACLLLVGSVVGAQMGARWSHHIPHAYNRLILACLLMLVLSKLTYGLFAVPDELYAIMERG